MAMELGNRLLKIIGLIGFCSLELSVSLVTIEKPSLAQLSPNILSQHPPMHPPMHPPIRRICNQTTEGIDIAVGFQDGVSKGWWMIKGGKCLKLDFDPVHGEITHYYAHTIRTTNRSRWFGDRSRSFCTAIKAFEIDSNGGCFNGAESRPFGLVGRGKNLTLE
jgi:Protein of unknown function (DUF1036)